MADFTLPGTSTLTPEDLANLKLVEQQRIAHQSLGQQAVNPDQQAYFEDLMQRRAQNLSAPQPAAFEPPPRPSFLNSTADAVENTASKAAPYVENEVVKDIALPGAEQLAKKAALMRMLGTGGRIAANGARFIPEIGTLMTFLDPTEAGANSDKPIGPQIPPDKKRY